MKNLSLFQNEPKYTFDTCSFNEIFDDERHFNKINAPGVWDGIQELISKGEIISHREVYEEIMKGPYKALKAWARQNSSLFLPYDFDGEGKIIAGIGERGFMEFVHQYKEYFNADPWLIAQAKINGLTIITQEKGKGPRDILKICEEFSIQYLDIFGLIKAKGWVLYKK